MATLKQSILIPSRRAFLVGASGIASNFLLPLHLVKACSTIIPASTAYPGQSGNPVGYAAAPGYPGSLTPHATSGWVSGTPGNPTVYSFLDIDAGTGGTAVGGSHITFIGCRFQSNQSQYYNIQCTGSNITFSYCSITPRMALLGNPPHPEFGRWPSGGAGDQTTSQTAGNSIPASAGYEYGINISSGGPVTIDHCDIWGFGNAIPMYSTTAQMTINDCWLHDASPGNGYHTDGPGYLNGGTPPQNVTVSNCTIGFLGNTNAIAFQAASSPYVNITVTGCYLSGDGYCVDMCHGASGSTNLTFTNNVFGTDIPWVWGPVYPGATALFSHATNPTNNWSGNKLKVLAGTSDLGQGGEPWTAGENGYYMWPDGSLHTTDFVA